MLKLKDGDKDNSKNLMYCCLDNKKRFQKYKSIWTNIVIFYYSYIYLDWKGLIGLPPQTF